MVKASPVLICSKTVPTLQSLQNILESSNSRRRVGRVEKGVEHSLRHHDTSAKKPLRETGSDGLGTEASLSSALKPRKPAIGGNVSDQTLQESRKGAWTLRLASCSDISSIMNDGYLR